MDVAQPSKFPSPTPNKAFAYKRNYVLSIIVYWVGLYKLKSEHEIYDILLIKVHDCINSRGKSDSRCS